MKNGSIEQGNFDTWTPMRLNQVPEIETVLIQNGHYPAGTGEPATTVVALQEQMLLTMQLVQELDLFLSLQRKSRVL